MNTLLKTSHFLPMSQMSRAELDEEIDQLNDECARARADPSLPFDGARLQALKQEAADRIPVCRAVDHFARPPAEVPCECPMCLTHGPYRSQPARVEGSR